MNTKTLKCVICDEEIRHPGIQHYRGNNAAPVKEGRCCDYCHQFVVVPARIGAIKNA